MRLFQYCFIYNLIFGFYHSLKGFFFHLFVICIRYHNGISNTVLYANYFFLCVLALNGCSLSRSYVSWFWPLCHFTGQWPKLEINPRRFSNFKKRPFSWKLRKTFFMRILHMKFILWTLLKYIFNYFFKTYYKYSNAHF